MKSILSAANKAATFRWEKDEEEIEENIENDDEKSRLSLKNVGLTDSGKYTCIADVDGKEYNEFVNIYVHGKTFYIFFFQKAF